MPTAAMTYQKHSTASGALGLSGLGEACSGRLTRSRGGSNAEHAQQPSTAAQSIASLGACGDCGSIEEANSCRSCGGSRNAGSSSCNRNSSSNENRGDGDFVSDVLLREFEFEDFSRASCWEQLQYELVSCLRRLPIIAARSLYLQQVANAHVEAASAASGASVHTVACMHSDASCSSSWHACAVPPPQFACLCCSPQQQQQQQRCALSLQLFAPLVLQLLLHIPKLPIASPKYAEGHPGQHLRITYTRAPPLPEFGCCCSSSSRSNSTIWASADAPRPEQQPPEGLRLSSPSMSPIYFDSSTDGCNSTGSSSSNKKNNKELRCGICAACILKWEHFFPSRAPSIQRSFGVSEFLQIETVRLCEVPDAAADAAAESTGCADQGAGPATRGAAAAVPLRVRKETARASLAALGIASRAAELRQLESAGQLQQHQQRQLLSQLPLFSLHDPQHGDCVGSQVLVCPASVGSGFATEASAAEAAPEDDEEAGAGGRKGSALLIRQYESRCLSSDFVDCDLSTFLHLLLPHLGAKLRQVPQSHEQHHALSLLQQLVVTAQYTYFLPSPWQQTYNSRQAGGALAAAVVVGPEAWWLHQTNYTSDVGKGTSSCGSNSSNSRSGPSECIISEWREVAVGAATLPLGSDGTPAPSADKLLQQLLLQRCPFEALHVIWCSPMQPLRDFWSSSSSGSRPLAAALDCRLRLNLNASLFLAHEKLVQHYSMSLKTLERQAQHATDFLQEDAWQQQCGVTSRVYQLSRLLLLAGRSSSNCSIKQQPFASLTSKAFRDIERARIRRREPHGVRMKGQSATPTKRSRRDSTSSLRNSSNSSSDSSSHNSSSQNSSSHNSSSNDSSSRNASIYSTTREAEAAAIEAEVQHLFRPMTRQQQLLIHEQQVKRLLLIGISSCTPCSCCCSACGCCGIDLAFALLWGSSSSSSFFAELALCAGEQQRLVEVQRLWQRLLMQLRWMWDRRLLLPRVVSGLTAATSIACAAEAAEATAKAEAAATNGCEPRGALAAGLGVACCPDGPSALPDVCCCSLQQQLQQLNCATQQQRLQWLLQDMPREQQQQPFESLRFVLPPPEGLSHFHEPILPILPPITEGTLAMHAALLRERNRSGYAARKDFGDHCEELLRVANKDACTSQASAVWWQHCFACLPRSVEQLLQQRGQLLQEREKAHSAALSALRASGYTREAVLQAARAATAAAVTAAAAFAAAQSEESQKPDCGNVECSAKVEKEQLFFNSLVEGEGALHGLESLTATDLLVQLLRVLVASLVEQCRLTCACVLGSIRRRDSRRCMYVPGVAAARCTVGNSCCKGRLFPCHIPALQAAADDLQRHAIAHAAGAAAAAADDALAWLPPLALLAACMRCEYIISAAVGLCRLIGTDPPALAIVNRALQLLLLRLQQQEQAAAAAASCSTGRREGTRQTVRKFPEAECDILLPILSCSEKRALQQMLNRYQGPTKNSAATTAEAATAPWEAVLPWPPFAQEFVLLLQSHTSDGNQQGALRKWVFYCREQHADRAFAVTRERCIQ